MKFKTINGFMMCLVLFGNIAAASEDNCATIVMEKLLSKMDGNVFYHHVTVIKPDIGEEFCKCDQESYGYGLRDINQRIRRKEVTQLLHTCRSKKTIEDLCDAVHVHRKEPVQTEVDDENKLGEVTPADLPLKLSKPEKPVVVIEDKVDEVPVENEDQVDEVSDETDKYIDPVAFYNTENKPKEVKKLGSLQPVVNVDVDKQKIESVNEATYWGDEQKSVGPKDEVVFSPVSNAKDFKPFEHSTFDDDDRRMAETFQDVNGEGDYEMFML